MKTFAGMSNFNLSRARPEVNGDYGDDDDDDDGDYGDDDGDDHDHDDDDDDDDDGDHDRDASGQRGNFNLTLFASFIFET